MKSIEKMNYVELKDEAKKRGVFDPKASSLTMKNAVAKHRADNPDFVIADKSVAPTVKVVKPFLATKKVGTESKKTNDDEAQGSPAEEKMETEFNESKTEKSKEMKPKKTKAAKPAKKAKVKKSKAVKKAVIKKIAAPKKAVTKKATVKKEKTKVAPINISDLKSKHKKILDADYKKKYKIVALFNEGVSKKEIEALLGTNQGWIWNELNSYKEDKKSFDKIISGK